MVQGGYAVVIKLNLRLFSTGRRIVFDIGVLYWNRVERWEQTLFEEFVLEMEKILDIEKEVFHFWHNSLPTFTTTGFTMGMD